MTSWFTGITQPLSPLLSQGSLVHLFGFGNHTLQRGPGAPWALGWDRRLGRFLKRRVEGDAI